MPTPARTPAPRLRHQLAALVACPESDAELLARFVGRGDQDAFAQIVRRHGPAVLAACRRVTGHRDDADDAFQATFLVLARKAHSVHPREAVGGWLYGVAIRAARKAAARSSRRRGRESPVAEVPDVPYEPTPAADPDDIRVVLEEVAGLSDPYRAAVVLCELEGRSRAAAARELGIPEGTLSSRLAAARKALAARLRHRGVVLSAAGLAVALGPRARAAVLGDLAAKAVALAAAPATAPAPVSAITEGVLLAMVVRKLNSACLAAVLVSLAACACGFVLSADPPVEPPKSAAPPVGRQDPAPARRAPPRNAAGKLLLARAGSLSRLGPDGKGEERLGCDVGRGQIVAARLSPDGTRVAYLPPRVNKPGQAWDGRHLLVRDLARDGAEADLGAAGEFFAWSPDGKRIAFSLAGEGQGPRPKMSHALVDVKTGEATPLKLPEHHIITDWSRDDKYLLTTSMDPDDQTRPVGRIHLMNLDGTEHKAVTDGKWLAVLGRLSPDGKRLLCVKVEVRKEGSDPRETLMMVEVGSGRATPVGGVPAGTDILGHCWSPDGKRIAYSWRKSGGFVPGQGAGKETESHLVVCDPDGENRKTIASGKDLGESTPIYGVDWR